jgi:hypothetical protein
MKQKWQHQESENESMSIRVVSEYSLLTTYACGHIWKTGLIPVDGSDEERERMKKAVEHLSESDCLYCQREREKGKNE